MAEGCGNRDGSYEALPVRSGGTGSSGAWLA